MSEINNSNKFQGLTRDLLSIHWYLWVTDKPHERFGQYICNRYLRDGVSWSDLFYETDPERAFVIIYNEVSE